MFETCCTPHDVAHLLRRRFGLPAELTAARVTVVCGPALGAVDMPVALGSRVLATLADPHVGPVIADPRDTVWTFLVAPDPAGHWSGATDAPLPGVRARAGGRRVMLPMTDHGFGSRWASEPRPGPLRLPPASAVAAALTALAEPPGSGMLPLVVDNRSDTTARSQARERTPAPLPRLRRSRNGTDSDRSHRPVS